MSLGYKKLRKVKRKRKKKDPEEEIEKWRAYWREAGPVRFAQEVLPCWPENPMHPDLGRIPEFNVLSEGQKTFLNDLWKRGFAGYVLLAARGAGKTYVLAIYACWRMCCFDYWTMTIMGGSSSQNMKCKRYIDFWRNQVDEINRCVSRSVESTKEPPHIESKWGSIVYFPACSQTGARSPHVREVHIDEVCSGEGKSKEGAAAIEAAAYQTTSSPDPILGYISTAQLATGIFIKMWKNYKKLGYKRYRWSMARHISPKWFLEDGKTPNWDYVDTVLYKDKNPEHWISNVWWETTENIKNLRKRSSDDQWLVEILGGISKGTGLVFSREDLAACICDGSKWTENGKPCDECRPYTEYCPMMKKKGLELSMIGNRRVGIDFGDVAPNAMTVPGEREGIIYVLYSDERVGLRSEEVLNWVEEKLKQYHVWIVFADPEERMMLQILEDKGYSTPHIWKLGGGVKKHYYVQKTKRFIEQHKLFIPKKFTFLINSLSELSYDSSGNILKHNDHSFDSLIYSMIDYEPDVINILPEISNKTISIW